MKKLIFTLALSIAAAHLATAAEVPNPAAEAADAPTTEAAPAVPPTIEVKTKSSFAMENGRNPFWPIGWKPAPKVTNSPTSETSGPEISPNAFLVSSIMMGQGTRFAIVNGKPMQEGQVFGLQMGNQVYQVTVKSIEDGQVIFQRRDQEIAAPLRRK